MRNIKVAIGFWPFWLSLTLSCVTLGYLYTHPAWREYKRLREDYANQMVAIEERVATKFIPAITNLAHSITSRSFAIRDNSSPALPVPFSSSSSDSLPRSQIRPFGCQVYEDNSLSFYRVGTTYYVRSGTVDYRLGDYFLGKTITHIDSSCLILDNQVMITNKQGAQAWNTPI